VARTAISHLYSLNFRHYSESQAKIKGRLIFPGTRVTVRG